MDKSSRLASASWLSDAFVKKYGKADLSKSKKKGDSIEIIKGSKRHSRDKDDKKQAKIKKTLAAIYAKHSEEANGYKRNGTHKYLHDLQKKKPKTFRSSGVFLTDGLKHPAQPRLSKVDSSKITLLSRSGGNCHTSIPKHNHSKHMREMIDGCNTKDFYSSRPYFMGTDSIEMFPKPRPAYASARSNAMQTALIGDIMANLAALNRDVYGTAGLLKRKRTKRPSEEKQKQKAVEIDHLLKIAKSKLKQKNKSKDKKYEKDSKILKQSVNKSRKGTCRDSLSRLADRTVIDYCKQKSHKSINIQNILPTDKITDFHFRPKLIAGKTSSIVIERPKLKASSVKHRSTVKSMSVQLVQNEAKRTIKQTKNKHDVMRVPSIQNLICLEDKLLPSTETSEPHNILTTDTVKLRVKMFKDESKAEYDNCQDTAQGIVYTMIQDEIGMLAVDYFNNGYQILFKPKMRLILIDWMLQVSQDLSLMRETVHYAISIVDRYFSIVQLQESRELQLIVLTSMILACKLEEVRPPSLELMISFCLNIYTEEELRKTEIYILKVIFLLSRY